MQFRTVECGRPRDFDLGEVIDGGFRRKADPAGGSD
jgi:hypothetical protein